MPTSHLGWLQGRRQPLVELECAVAVRGVNHGFGWFEISGIAGDLSAPHPGPPTTDRLPTTALEPDFGRCLTAGLL